MTGLEQMYIRPMEREDVLEVVELWNEEAVKYHYQPLERETFIAKFLDHIYYEQPLVVVGTVNDQIIAFAAGCVGDDLPLGEVSGYITTVIGSSSKMEPVFYDQLIGYLEQAFVHLGKRQADILFFNPVQLSWSMPSMPAHEHNNAPGIDRQMPFFKALIGSGYVERATQCGMHLALGEFRIPADVREKEQKAAEAGYIVTFFEPTKHRGIEAMLDGLNNEQWRRDVAKYAADGVPIVVAIQDNNCVGFAGPIIREASGRAFFSGIGVHPEHEGHGLGTVLFFRMIEAFQQANCRYVTLFTGSNNPAIRIYTKAGFQIEKQFAVLRKELI